MNRFYVYELIDPRTNKPFYVGKGSGDRVKQHLIESSWPREKQINKFKCAVINNILSTGKDIVHNLVQKNMIEQDAFDLEISLIAKYGKRIDGSGSLTNMCDGGLGGYGNSKSIRYSRSSC